MNRDQAKEYIKRHSEELLDRITRRAQRKVKGNPTWVCPIPTCNHGSNEGDEGLVRIPDKPTQWKCFKCGFSGDVIDLYCHVLDMDYNEALKECASRLGIGIDNGPKQTREPANPYAMGDDPEPDVFGDFSYTRYFEQCRERLRTDPAARGYLSSRGISLETAQQFGLGYDPEWRSPNSIRKGYNPPSSPRIIIPTSDHHYVARDTRQNLSKKQQQYKQMNEGKAACLNLSALYQSIGSEEEEYFVFVHEGPFDALSTAQFGYPSIALCSVSNVSLFMNQVKACRPNANTTLLLSMDKDDAGRGALAQLEAELKQYGVKYMPVDIAGNHKDANEALVADQAEFQKAVRKAIDGAKKAPDGAKEYILTRMADDIAHFRTDIQTGFASLDSRIGGLYAGLYVLAAIPSLGKTTFLTQLAEQVAMAGHHVIFVSLEQSRLEIIAKGISRRTYQNDPRNAVTEIQIRSGWKSETIATATKQYVAEIGNRLNVIEGNFNVNCSFIGNYVRTYARRNGSVPVLVVDYIQAIPPEKKFKQQLRETVDENVVFFKRLSRDLNTPVILVSSLNRTNYVATFGYESLKETGTLEYDADFVAGLQLSCIREDSEFFDKQNKVTGQRERIDKAKAQIPRSLDLNIVKNRFGRANLIHQFEYDPRYNLFTDQGPVVDTAATSTTQGISPFKRI